MKKKSSLHWLLLIAILAVFIGTGKQVSAAEISMSQSSATIRIGSSIKLQVLYGGKTVSGAAWGSSDTSVATVDNNGVVTGKAKGSTVITAMYSGSTAECVVSVVKNVTSKIKRYNVLILDTSSSMSGSPIKQVKKAASRFARTVIKADGSNYVAVVTLNGSSDVICRFTTRYATVKEAIYGTKARGLTNMRAAFDEAYSLMKEIPDGENVIKNVVLCSDGLPCTGLRSTSGRYSSSDHKYYRFANAVYKTDTKMKKDGYFIYALGFFHNSSGKDLVFGKRLMKDLASKDKYYLIQDGNDIQDAFDDIAEQIISITISEKSLILTEGDQKTLTVYRNGIKTKASWSSDDSSIVKVYQTGKIKAVRPGTTIVRAALNGTTVSCTVTVKEIPTTISLDKSSLTIEEGKSKKLTAVVTGNNKDITWTSTDTGIANVSGSGETVTVKAKKAGSCDIIASCNGKTAQCRVTVKPLKDITGAFILYGEAVRLDDGSIRLTECATWRSGSVWYPDPVNTEKGLDISFQYWAGGGRDKYLGGADGIILNIAENPGLGIAGGELGFTGHYGIELDSFANSYDPSPKGKHVAVVQGKTANHLCYVLDDRVDDSAWHTLRVTVKNHVLRVYLDGALLLKQNQVVLNAETYLGLSAATGDGVNEHIIRKFLIRE